MLIPMFVQESKLANVAGTLCLLHAIIIETPKREIARKNHYINGSLASAALNAFCNRSCGNGMDKIRDDSMNKPCSRI